MATYTRETDPGRDDLIAAFRDAKGDVMTQLFFPNGYGVSVVRHSGSCGGRSGLYELAVLKGTPQDYELCYTTPITGDVLGYLSPEEVVDITAKVGRL